MTKAERDELALAALEGLCPTTADLVCLARWRANCPETRPCPQRLCEQGRVEVFCVHTTDTQGRPIERVFFRPNPWARA